MCGYYPQSKVAETVGVAPQTICDLKNRGWRVAYDEQRLPKPEDFDDVLRRTTWRRAQAHYGVSYSTIAKWAGKR
jgi:hypothetical protein